MRQDETATKDMKMGETPTWTWPNPQNGKQPHLKFRLGTYVSPHP